MGRKPKEGTEVRHPKVPREEMVDFIKAHYELFTTTEIAEMAGYSRQQVQTMCENSGYIPISIGERVKKYLECNMHLTIEQQCKKLELLRPSLMYYYRQFGFDPKNAGKGKKINPTLQKVGLKQQTELRETPMELLLGPIARSFCNKAIDTLEVINKVRYNTLTS